MLFGIDIDTWYAIVLGATGFCVLLGIIAYIVHEIRQWRIWRSKNDSNSDKS